MRPIIFFAILIAIILEDFVGLYLPGIKGFSLRNFAMYIGILFLVQYFLSRGRPKIPRLSLLMIIFCWALLSIIYVQTLSSLKIPLIDHLKFFKDAIFNPILIYIFVFIACRNEKKTSQYLLSILILFATLNLLALFQMVSGAQVFKTIQHYEGASRFAGFGNPNKTAYYLVFITPLLYYFFRFQSNGLIKIFAVSAIVLNFVSVALSGSRGGILCFFLSLFLIAIFFREKKLFIFSIILGLFALPLFLMSETVIHYFSSTIERIRILFTEKDVEVLSAHRTIIWKALWDDVSSSPITIIFGIGIGTIKDVGIGAGSHNWYLGQFVQYGITGLFFTFYTIYSYFKLTKNNVNKMSKNFSKIILTSMLVMMTGFLFSSMGGLIVLLAFTFATMLSHLIYLESHQESHEL